MRDAETGFETGSERQVRTDASIALTDTPRVSANAGTSGLHSIKIDDGPICGSILIIGNINQFISLGKQVSAAVELLKQQQPNRVAADNAKFGTPAASHVGVEEGGGE